ncbi:MAG: hypothetical protein JRF51_17940 [Deltaproteobacteria bacterium]|nr:hypothetical protein [Deltaproteobacteria bacterium]
MEDRGNLLRDNAASSAILDRLLHRGHLLNFKGKSYRLKEAASRLSEIKRKNQDEKRKSMDFYPPGLVHYLNLSLGYFETATGGVF